MKHAASCLALVLLAACQSAPVSTPVAASSFPSPDTSALVQGLLPANAILLGEQHDAPEHQRIEREAVQALASRSALAAVAIEMAPQGGSTRGLPPDAGEAAVKSALQWDDKLWPWASYGPAVMAAVRAGVPVLGANLRRDAMAAAMADGALDGTLPGPALKAQQQAVRIGHCGLLPEDRITPLTRIQIARDRAMAQTVAEAAVPGRTVLLIAGGGHVDRRLGVPQHLPPGFDAKAVGLQSRPGEGAEKAERAEKSFALYDATWATAPGALKDYCADLQRAMPTPARP